MGGSKRSKFRSTSHDASLAVAAANAKLPLIRELLSKGANPSGVAHGSTALHEAARLGLVQPAEILIEHATDLSVEDEDDMTPLMSACNCGKTKGSRVASLLLAAGADATLVRDDEMTALKFAVKDGTPELVQQLIDAGASVDGPAGTSQTALVLAARANRVDILKVLIENGADPNKKCGLPWAKGKTAAEIAVMEKQRKAAKYLQELRPKRTQ